MSTSLDFSVAIISHRQMHLVKRLLLSLLKADLVTSLEIIIIENDPRGATEFQHDFDLPISYFVNNHPKGYAANINAAFSQASGRFFCTINPDVLILQETLAPLMEDIREGRGDIVAPAVVDHRDRLQDSARNLPTPWSLILRRLMVGRFLPENIDNISEHPDWIAGMLLLMESKLFGDLGGMDERFFLYFEDAEFCTRARLAGYQLFVDRSVRIRHDARRRSRRELRYAAWHLRSAYRFFRSDVYRQARRLKNA